jgi:hypothetical protein
LEVLNNKESIISIDFIEGSAVEIADCGLELFDPKTRAISKLERTIKPSKHMVWDNFHARDYTDL